MIAGTDNWEPPTLIVREYLVNSAPDYWSEDVFSYNANAAEQVRAVLISLVATNLKDTFGPQFFDCPIIIH